MVKTNIFVLAINPQDVLKSSSKHFQNVFKKFARRLQDVLQKRRHLQDVLPRRLQNVFKKSCKNVFKTSSRRFQDVLQRYLQNIFKTYHQVKLFFLTSLRDVFNTFLRCTAKTVIYRRICLGHTSDKFMVSVQNLQA